ncbi:ABC transporter ATP-binding protein [Viridibacillus sp. YIM B01967]|uniref:ABC transporter ATP-binding protein n=1 Tax=Viridibacillus soli TaxID=2798301 RepID=A0ABS1HB62_9BACL|nr:ABC transporter ATP-binding protein [Viridibacillus soli]MBK3496633.1 ABC transporter ATP-binding protein [Viridibacillus soli]
MITVEGIAKKYGKNSVLEDVSFTIPKGKIIGLAGENGSGKSTVLKIIAGVLESSNGSVKLDGTEVTRRSAERIAYLPDLDLFYPYFTGEELFHYYGSQFDDFHYDKACIVAQFLNIPLDVKIKKMSKGNRGRVKMAATLGREATYYLMDEPFSGFDPLVREDLIKGLIQFTDPETQSIFLSTHEIREVEPLLDGIIVLHNGKIVAQEEIENIREEYNQDTVTWLKKLLKEGDKVEQ